MEWTTVYISSVTNAMRGKALLERQGFTVHMQRSSRAKETDGCGYSLLVRGEVQPITALLGKAGIRVLRTEHGGVRR
ncbi:MAG: hypothetical protein IJO75_05655 [Clostridia bacterium]|nr:hypothetical protein [Clostridia bacterium]